MSTTAPQLIYRRKAAYVTDMALKPTVPIQEDIGTHGMIAGWYGYKNDFPHKVIEDIEKNPQLSSEIYWKSNAIISGGLQYGYIDYDENGKEKMRPIKVPEIEAFLRRSNYKLFLRELSHEFYRFWNAFPELIRSRDRKKITGFRCHESSFCRWERQNKQGLIENCYINANFDRWHGDNSPYTTTLPAIYRYFDRVESTRERAGNSFIYPVAGTSSGYIYYQMPPWAAIRKSGWLEVVNKIPQFKKALMDNQLSIKYIIKMPDWWMEYKHKNLWDTLDDEKRQELIQQEYDEFDEFLTGVENTGKSILVMMRTDPNTKEMYDGWKVDEINPKLMDAAYNDDSEIGASYISNALGLHGTLTGTTPGKSGLGSKGSEIRNLFNIYIANSKPEQDIILEVFEFIRDYNGWDENIQFWFKNYWLQTMDQVTPSQRNLGANE